LATRERRSTYLYESGGSQCLIVVFADISRLSVPMTSAHQHRLATATPPWHQCKCTTLLGARFSKDLSARGITYEDSRLMLRLCDVIGVVAGCMVRPFLLEELYMVVRVLMLGVEVIGLTCDPMACVVGAPPPLTVAAVNYVAPLKATEKWAELPGLVQSRVRGSFCWRSARCSRSAVGIETHAAWVEASIHGIR
jgi:hypothetical protein